MYSILEIKKKIRIGRIVKMFADKREDIDSISTGDIVAVVGICQNR
jgi:translation elongation factor EF-G